MRTRLTVNDLSGTDVTEVKVDLAGTLNGNTGDAAADNVVVNGTNGNDVIVLSGSAAGVNVLGLAAKVSVTVAEPASDRLTVNGLGGDDVIEASGVQSGAIALTLSGGDLDDVLIGGAGNDTLFGKMATTSSSAGRAPTFWTAAPAPTSRTRISGRRLAPDDAEADAAPLRLLPRRVGRAQRGPVAAGGQRLAAEPS